MPRVDSVAHRVKILLVATRSVEGPRTGRKVVLATIVRSCKALGHQVDIAVIGPSGPSTGGISIQAPGFLRVGHNFVRHFLLGRKSLNECLYWSRQTRRRIAGLVVSGAYDMVVADMLSSAQFCSGLNVPWILDLDDLLSDRYAGLAAAEDGRMVLGYFSHRLPMPLRRSAAWIAHRLLKFESRRIAAQERRFGLLADAVTLVSSIDTALTKLAYLRTVALWGTIGCFPRAHSPGPGRRCGAARPVVPALARATAWP